MRARLAVFTAPLVLGLVQCGSITVPTSDTPVNTCAGCIGSEVQCAQTASGPACLSTASTTPPYVLVVNVPESVLVAPGETVALTSECVASPSAGAAAKCGTVATPCPSSVAAPCLELQFPYSTTGAYKDGTGAIPALTSYAPTWSLSVPACEPKGCENSPPIEASLLNLPLPTVFAAGSSGGWAALLPQLSSGYVQVVDPADIADPPLVRSASDQMALENANISDDGINFQEAPPSPLVSTSISIAMGAVEGWRAFFRQRTTRRIVSSQPVVQDGNATIEWLASGILNGLTSLANRGDYQGYDLVFSPPAAAVGLPEYAAPYLGQSIEPYKQVPKPVTVSGMVRSPAGKGVSASLHFVSLKGLYTEAACDLPSPFLHYDVVVFTDEAGRYKVVVPQGQYLVTVDPDPTSGFAKTQTNARMPSSGPSSAFLPIDLPMSDPCTNTEETYNPTLGPRIDVAGTVWIADNRPLANATVELTPAASLLTAPSALQPDPWPALGPTQLLQPDWPRPVEVVTGSDGTFRASVDPGPYDVTVRPVDGTRLPWIVSPADFATGVQVFAPSDKDKTGKPIRLLVPAPVAIDLTLEDALGNDDLQNAVVRAYAFTSCTPPTGETTCNGVALQIGQAFTDGLGHFEMFLTPIPFTARK